MSVFVDKGTLKYFLLHLKFPDDKTILVFYRLLVRVNDHFQSPKGPDQTPIIQLFAKIINFKKKQVNNKKVRVIKQHQKKLVISFIDRIYVDLEKNTDFHLNLSNSLSDVSAANLWINQSQNILNFFSFEHSFPLPQVKRMIKLSLNFQNYLQCLHAPHGNQGTQSQKTGIRIPTAANDSQIAQHQNNKRSCRHARKVGQNPPLKLSDNEQPANVG